MSLQSRTGQLKCRMGGKQEKSFVRGNLCSRETTRCSEGLLSKVVVLMHIQAPILVILFPQQADENSTLPLKKA